MAETFYGIVFLTGVMAWAAIAAGVAFLALATLAHAHRSWEMSGRIVRETKTKTSRLKWWREMFMTGPVTSIQTIDDGHTIYWPGKEPKGWYAD